jgi:ABC-type multidrug transport system fused ATPase/permease subunit
VRSTYLQLFHRRKLCTCVLLHDAGGCNIRQLDPVWFRRHIGLVNQEPVLFASSIADNISYGRDDATSDEVCCV